MSLLVRPTAGGRTRLRVTHAVSTASPGSSSGRDRVFLPRVRSGHSTRPSAFNVRTARRRAPAGGFTSPRLSAAERVWTSRTRWLSSTVEPSRRTSMTRLVSRLTTGWAP